MIASARVAALLSSPDGGALLRVIVGEVAGHQGPGITYAPIALLHATLAPGARLRLPGRPDYCAGGHQQARAQAALKNAQPS